jgi:hypothetical protein
MSFSGISTNKYFTPNLVGEDVSEVFKTLAPYEAPFLDWVGDADGFATNTRHESKTSCVRVPSSTRRRSTRPPRRRAFRSTGSPRH